LIDNGRLTIDNDSNQPAYDHALRVTTAMPSYSPQSTAYSLFDGWRIVGITALVVGGLVAASALTTPDSDDAVHIVMRVTVRLAVVLFLLAFSASALAQLWPCAWTRWQRRNRRYLGVSFAVAHFTHFAAILSLRVIAPEHFATIPAITWVFGGIAYVFVAAMTARPSMRPPRSSAPRPGASCTRRARITSGSFSRSATCRARYRCWSSHRSRPPS
jgi:sulfoxide reductase heme-binding subunit YedZ